MALDTIIKAGLIVDGAVTQERRRPTGDLGGRTLRSYAYAKAA